MNFILGLVQDVMSTSKQNINMENYVKTARSLGERVRKKENK
ncbi:hypothetical protein LCGC14_1319800 [marine sediment metagenome]|uniref:Uncharacterized protein n=1 Tax=marine sediment metagenome TaxID=412755 RepID=A0A0F9KKE9_9ZZZZ